MKNAKSKSRQIIYEFITIVLFCAFLILSILVTFNDITLPEKLILTFPDNEDLFINLFTIQATVSTLSIAVVALITGFFSENIYGISVIGYITSIRPWAFKHKHLILFDLIIIAVNYYLVSMKYYNISIDHLNRTRQTIRIVADIEYKLLDNTVGSGIEITFD